MTDLRFAIRQLWKHKGSTFLAVVILALGIGGTTAVYSVADKVLLNPIPGRASDRLVSVWERDTVLNTRWGASPPLINELAAQTNLVGSLTYFFRLHEERKLRRDGRFVQLKGASVAPNFFEMLELRPAVGRSRFSDRESGDIGPEIVLGHGVWQRLFGGDEQIVGSDLELDGEFYSVIGVMPPNVRFPFGSYSDFWISGGFSTREISGDGADRNRMWQPILRLRSGVELEELQSWLEVVAARRQSEVSEPNERWVIESEPARLTFGGRALQKSIWSLLAMMGALLLIACANVGNLLLARALSRRGEFGVRLAIGAGRLRIARQLLVESLVLAGLAASLGVFVAWGGIKALEQFYLSTLPRIHVIGLDRAVLVSTAGLALLVGVLFGTAPAWLAARVNLSRTLKESAKQHGGGAFQRLFHDGLVVIQVSLTVVLLFGAGVTTWSVAKLLQVNPGLEAKGLYRVFYDATDFMNQRRQELHNEALQSGLSRAEASRVAWQAQRDLWFAFERDALEHLHALPGVESAAVNGDAGGRDTYEIEGRPGVVTLHVGDVSVLHGDYLRTVKAELISGRLLDRADADAGQISVVINQHMAEVYWPGESPLGKRFGQTDPASEYQVVGVVADMVNWRLDAAKEAAFYEPFERNTKSLGGVGDYVVRSSLEPDQLRAAVVQAGREMLAPVELRVFHEIEARLLHSTAPRRVMMWLLLSLGAMALFLSAMGVYAVMAFTVTRRVHEIGIRMAVGARREEIRSLFLKQGMRLIAGGLALGLVGAYTAIRYFESLLFGVTPANPWSYAAVVLILLLAGGVACWIPARRAASVDPMEALRGE